MTNPLSPRDGSHNDAIWRAAGASVVDVMRALIPPPHDVPRAVSTVGEFRNGRRPRSVDRIGRAPIGFSGAEVGDGTMRAFDICPMAEGVQVGAPMQAAALQANAGPVHGARQLKYSASTHVTSACSSLGVRRATSLYQACLEPRSTTQGAGPHRAQLDAAAGRPIVGGSRTCLREEEGGKP